MDKQSRKVLQCFTMILQIGISMMVPIFLCAGIGWWLDRQFHTQVWFLIMLFIGIGAAFRNVYILTRSIYSEDMREEHERLKYIQDLKEYSKNHPTENGTEEDNPEN